jgi:hypothetical protein
MKAYRVCVGRDRTGGVRFIIGRKSAKKIDCRAVFADNSEHVVMHCENVLYWWVGIRA